METDTDREVHGKSSCKGFCVGVLTQSSLLQGSKVIQEFTGLHSLGLGPQSCKPCHGGDVLTCTQRTDSTGVGTRGRRVGVPQSAGVPVSRGSGEQGLQG